MSLQPIKISGLGSNNTSNNVAHQRDKYGCANRLYHCARLRFTSRHGELDNHIQLTRQEHGCLQFEVTQSRLNPCRFEVCETFRDPTAFAAHQARVKASHWGEITVNVERHYTVTGLGE